MVAIGMGATEAVSYTHLSLCELIVGGKDGLAPVEKTIIDRCVRIVYRDM